MNEFVHFQLVQRQLVEAGLDTTLAAHREGNEAVFSLSVHLHEQNPDTMARLTEVTTKNQFTFTIDRHNTAALVPA